MHAKLREFRIRKQLNSCVVSFDSTILFCRLWRPYRHAGGTLLMTWCAVPVAACFQDKACRSGDISPQEERFTEERGNIAHLTAFSTT